MRNITRKSTASPFDAIEGADGVGLIQVGEKITGIAVGSWWGLLVFVRMKPALVWWLLDEERLLASNLAGCSEYRTEVRFRLVPHIW